MNNSSDIKVYINKYITFHTSSAVEQRGEQLFKNQLVEFVNYDENKDTWSFFVEGSEIYEVHIKGANSLNVEPTCSCPFDWGSTCKHKVASLLFVSNNIDNIDDFLVSDIPIIKLSEKNIVSTKRADNAPYEIKDYYYITNKFIKANCTVRVMNQLNYGWMSPSIKKINVSDASIEFHLINDRKGDIVRIYLENKKAYILSTELESTNKLRYAEAFCLSLIANSNTPDVLNSIFNNTINDNKIDLYKRYGLPTTIKFDKYFEYDFDPTEGLSVIFNKKGLGLVSISDDEHHPIHQLLNNKGFEDLLFQDLPQKNEQRKLGFALRFSKYDDYDYHDYDYGDDSMLQFVPIIGKLNKANNMFATHIQEYDEYSSDNYHIVKSESVKKILHDITILENVDNEIKEFQLNKQVFNNLTKEKLVHRIDSYHIKKKNLQQITLSTENVDILFEVSKNTDFLEAKMKVRIGSDIFDVEKAGSVNSRYEVFELNNTYYFAKNYQVSQFIKKYFGSFKMIKTKKAEFYNKIIQPLSKNYEVTFKKGTFSKESVELDFNKKQVFLSEQNDYIIISPQVVYQNNISVMLNSMGNVLVNNDNNITEYKRNFELEDEFVNLISEFHPNFESQKNRKQFYLHNSEFTENMWFYKFFDKLQKNNIEVFGLKNLKNFKYSPYKGKIKTTVSSDQDWFEVSVNVSFGDNSVSLNDIRKSVINKQRYIQLNDGSVGILPSDWFHKLEKYFRNGIIKKDKLEISKLRFSIVDELFDDIDDAEIVNDINAKRKKLAAFTEITKTKIPKQVKANLRHYQKEGVNWLNFLDQMQWGGILADDMGLGKTLQILTFIQMLINKKKSTNLIVVPTTLLFNWENEIAKFTPSLKAFYYYGTDRKKDTEIFKDYHLVFTTYGILLRDIEILKDFKFNYVILDESQAIKNPASRRFKAACLINAKNRIALSGTPIENGTFDLFAQMSFANRGFFGSANSFKENYSNPIDKDGNETIAAELHRIINPFVLRRTKEKVATELPAKTEDVIYCEMESEQRLVYDAYRNEYKNQLLNKIEDEGVGKSKMMVLEALTRLRQICDSPALLNTDDTYNSQSIKIKEILRHITNKTANHKILIFSQFVKMLGLVKDELAKLNIEYEYLDGKSSTKQREQSVNNFQENNDLRVFLISLKAGGTGLNLTAADYVYILDPWWNPAVENQAIDRCYRIGQDKKVFAYRMICKNTVEEKIVNLQNKKKKIAGDIIQTDDNIMKTLKANDIKELFS